MINRRKRRHLVSSINDHRLYYEETLALRTGSVTHVLMWYAHISYLVLRALYYVMAGEKEEPHTFDFTKDVGLASCKSISDSSYANTQRSHCSGG
ncbi:hypothetical protein L1887_29352 [Cichorium endivia]|nr:hypothetical protein L1887_29352 [Cichorium endivia]